MRQPKLELFNYRSVNLDELEFRVWDIACRFWAETWTDLLASKQATKFALFNQLMSRTQFRFLISHTGQFSAIGSTDKENDIGLLIMRSTVEAPLRPKLKAAHYQVFISFKAATTSLPKINWLYIFMSKKNFAGGYFRRNLVEKMDSKSYLEKIWINERITE